MPRPDLASELHQPLDCPLTKRVQGMPAPYPCAASLRVVCRIDLELGRYCPTVPLFCGCYPGGGYIRNRQIIDEMTQWSAMSRSNGV